VRKFEDFDKIKDWLLPEYENEEELIKKMLLGSNLYGTILVDAYRRVDIPKMKKALKNLCGKGDEKPFGTYGIYVYWNFYTKEILYIGLSKNLINRFSQHNSNQGRIKGNKSAKIRVYFQMHEKLGFSILLQPPLVQDFDLAFSFDKDTEVKLIESSLFQSFIDQNGCLPPWNEAEGSKTGRLNDFVNRYGDVLDMLNLKSPGYLNSNYSIRELENNIEYQKYECDLNLIRAHMYQWKTPFEETVAKVINWNNFIASKGNLLGIESNIRIMKLLDSSYLNKKRISL